MSDREPDINRCQVMHDHRGGMVIFHSDSAPETEWIRCESGLPVVVGQ